MGARRLPTAVAWQGLDVVVSARVINVAGTLVDQASISSIAYKTVNMTLNDQVDGTGTFDKASVVYDTPQSADQFWPFDEEFNLRCTIPGAKLPNAESDYEIQILLTPTGGDSDIMVAGEIHTRKVH